MYRNTKENIASPEMVKALIEKYCSFIDDDEPSPVMREILERNIPKDELNKYTSIPKLLLEETLKNFNELKDSLEELTTLSCILDDSSARFRDKEAYDKYVNYLISNVPDLLFNATTLLTWLYNERTYGTPTHKKTKE